YHPPHEKQSGRFHIRNARPGVHALTVTSGFHFNKSFQPASLKPTTPPRVPASRNGRRTRRPLRARRSIASEAAKPGSFSLSFSRLYSLPDVLKSLRTAPS